MARRVREPRLLALHHGPAQEVLEQELHRAGARERLHGAAGIDQHSPHPERLTQLAAIFPDRSFDPCDAAEYNRLQIGEFDKIRDFIILHYKATTRDDAPLWQYCRDMSVPETLTYRMDLFRSSGRVAYDDRELFVESNWLSVFIGQQIWPRRYDPLADVVPMAEAVRQLQRLKTLIRQTAEAMPTHAAFIASHCAAEKRA